MALRTAILLFFLAPHAALPPVRCSLDDARAAARIPLRIGLVRFFARAHQLTLDAPAGARLLGADGSELAKGPGAWDFTRKEGRVCVQDEDGRLLAAGETLRVEPPDDGTPLALSLPTPSQESKRRTVQEASERSLLPVQSSAALTHAVAQRLTPPHRYRGALEIAAANGSLRAVNIVPLETYLRGVIAEEMPPSAPPEALRTQAVCARTYALRSRGRFRAQGYDLTDTTASQVYGGVAAERGTTDAAVRDTAWLALARNGEIIEADYYDDCGGVTSAGESDDDYPPSVTDAPEDGGPDYCARGTYHTWTLKLTAEEIAKRLTSTVLEKIGPLREIEVTEKDASGRARRVRLTGDSGGKEMKGYAFRALLGYDRLKSTLFIVTRSEGGDFIFEGRGYGHGHGLCQWGAMGMAAAPYNHTCRDILLHYFPGAELVALNEVRTMGGVVGSLGRWVARSPAPLFPASRKGGFRGSR